MANAVAASTASPRPLGPLKLDSSSSQPNATERVRNAHLGLDTLSPVNQKGHFEFDRVIKSGQVLKRTRKTKSWRPIYLVLRPNLLSIYRKEDETKLRHKIILSDLTAIARQRDPKGKAKHVFGLFSPSRNFHLGAKDDKEAQEWVELIRREARIDEDEEDMNLMSPGGRPDSRYTGFGRHGRHPPPQRSEGPGFSSSDPDPFPQSSPTRTAPAFPPGDPRRPSTTLDYSGPENASYSDFSDFAGNAARLSALSLSRPKGLNGDVPEEPPSPQPDLTTSASPQPQDPHALEEASARATVAQMQAAARIICQDWVLLLRSRGAVKQWKKTWMVLRPGSLSMYKNEKESSAVKIIHFDEILDAVEIDPISGSKRFCFQVITEEKGYRFCAPDEDKLLKWLGAFKSLLVKRRGEGGSVG
ncbi:PH domain-containing protein 2 [Elsinoe fawcettii]|nr:PH domain-containing protein 2 [Elsinoe fawcettii]